MHFDNSAFVISSLRFTVFDIMLTSNCFVYPLTDYRGYRQLLYFCLWCHSSMRLLLFPEFERGISPESLERKDSSRARSLGCGSVLYIPFCCFEITVPPCSLNPLALLKYMLPAHASSIDLQVYPSHPRKTWALVLILGIHVDQWLPIFFRSYHI